MILGQVSTLTLNPDEDQLTSAVIDSAAGFAYFGTNANDVFKVEIAAYDFSLSNSGDISVQQGSLGTSTMHYYTTDNMTRLWPLHVARL